MPKKRAPTVWHVGDRDLGTRVPLLHALCDQGFDVVAVGTHPDKAFQGGQVRYHEYPLRRGLTPIGDWRALAALRRLVAGGRPDIVHAFNTKPAILVPLCLSDAVSPRCVRTITGMGHLFASRSPLSLALRPTYRVLQRRTNRRCDMTLFQNEDDRAYFLAHDMASPSRCRVVLGSGLDTVAFISELPGVAERADLARELGVAGCRVVTMISRLITTKGPLDFLEAAQRVCAKLDDVAFLLVGPLRSEGRQAVSARQIERLTGDRIRYVGPRSDVPGVLAVSDLFVFPSYYREGLPRVLLEAGAAGLPVVTTDVPGCREVIRDGWNGLLVPPRNPAELARAICRLLDDTAMASRMGARARQRVRQAFDLSEVVAAYTAIYREVLGRGPSGCTGKTDP